MLKKTYWEDWEDTIKYLPKGAKWLLKGVNSTSFIEVLIGTPWEVLVPKGVDVLVVFFLEPIMSQIEKKAAATTSYNDANKNELNSSNLFCVTFLIYLEMA